VDGLGPGAFGGENATLSPPKDRAANFQFAGEFPSQSLNIESVIRRQLYNLELDNFEPKIDVDFL
jgi:hypothetical protein